MKNPPKLEMEKTVFERLFDWLGILSFAAIILYLLVQWPSIPENVPMHFNAAGEVDGWGAKWTIFALPIVGAALWIGMYFLEKMPHVHNYLNLTEENIRQQYKNSQLLLNVMKNEILIFFVYITWLGVRIAKGQTDTLDAWVLPIFLIVLFGSMGFFMVRSLRLK